MFHFLLGVGISILSLVSKSQTRRGKLFMILSHQLSSSYGFIRRTIGKRRKARLERRFQVQDFECSQQNKKELKWICTSTRNAYLKMDKVRLLIHRVNCNFWKQQEHSDCARQASTMFSHREYYLVGKSLAYLFDTGFKKANFEGSTALY